MIKQRQMPLVLVVLAMTAGLTGLSGCSGIRDLLGLPPQEGGCNPQVPASGFRTQAATPMGILEIKVLDVKGVPQASASVVATRLVKTGARCPSSIQGETDSAGVVRFERLKTGPFGIVVFGPQEATMSAQIEDGKTTSVIVTVES
ncbi:hypothetical protein D3C86_503180 [compost metagenome]